MLSSIPEPTRTWPADSRHKRYTSVPEAGLRIDHSDALCPALESAG